MNREQIIQMARECLILPFKENDDNGTGMWATFTVYKGSIEALEKFASLVAAAEREGAGMNTQPEALLYPKHSAQALGSDYIAHVMAMTREKLHEKSDIAIQLAWRDAELRRLHEVNQELLEALDGVMYWDNGKSEWETARAAIAKHGSNK